MFPISPRPSCSRSRPTPTSVRPRGRSTWRSSPCRPRASSRWSGSARRRGCRRSSWLPRGSPMPAPRGPRDRRRWSTSAGRPDPHGGTELDRHRLDDRRPHVQRHRRPLGTVGGAGRLPLAERFARPGGGRAHAADRPRALPPGLGRQQGRHLRQRPPGVLGGRSPHRRDRALPGVVRQRAALLAPGAPPGPAQAGAGGEERPHRRRRAGEQHQRVAPERGRRHPGRACSGSPGDTRRVAGRPARHREPAVAPAGPPRPAGRHPDQRGWLGRPVRGCLRDGRARGPGSPPRDSGCGCGPS